MSFSSRPGRAARPLLLIATAALALWGCDGGVKDPTTATGPGAVLKVSASAVFADQDLVLDATGSVLPARSAASRQAGSPKTPCPDGIYFFTDDVAGQDATILGDKIKTVIDGEGRCRVLDGKVTVKLKRGASPGVRDQKISVLVEELIQEEKGDIPQITSSSADTTVRVATLEPGQTPPAGTPAPAPTSAPGTTPTPTPTPDHTDDGSFKCNFRTSHDDAHVPEPKFVVNPTPMVAGSPVQLDGSASTDPDGNTTIVRWRWDFDGDGVVDSENAHPFAMFTPAAAGTRRICLEVTDADGNRQALDNFTDREVKPAGYLVGGAPSRTPSGSATVGQTVTFLPEPNPDVDALQMIFGMSPDADPDFAIGDYTTTYETSYASPGLKEVSTIYQNTAAPGGTQVSEWTSYVPVVTVRSGAPKARAAAKAKSLSLSTSLTGSRKIVSPGTVTIAGAQVSTKNAIVTGRMNAKPSKAAKKKLPKGTSVILKADYALSFTGRRVVQRPGVSGLAGTGLALARATKDSKTQVCLRVKTDGLTAAGTTWTVLGATGKLAGYKGGGTMTPPSLGGSGSKADTATLKLTKSGKRKGVAACKALTKRLPKLKKKR